MSHPTEFHVVHAFFPNLRNQQWGGLTDGPADQQLALTLATDHFIDNGRDPSLDNLRVYQFQDDAPARDVTEDFIELIWERLVTSGHREMPWAAE